jgi:glycosidase
MKKYLISITMLLCVICHSSMLIAQQLVPGLPNRTDVTLYQINIRAFSKEGNLRGILPRLDSIKNLGVNVIYLMPIYPVGKVNSVNSPYCISDYKAVNPEFGKLADLQVLVDSIHSKKMSVILDWVPNHTSYDHVWIKNKTWYLQDKTGKILPPPKTGWNDVAQLNFDNMDMRAEMISDMKYWVNTANVDGFRCDFADGPPLSFWKQAITELRAMPDHHLLLLAEGKRPDHYKAGFDYIFGFQYFEHLKDIYGKGKTAKSINEVNKKEHKGAKDGQQVVRYTTNHDVNGSDGTPQDLFGGEKGSIAAFVTAAYMNSIPMVYNGQEVGTPYRLVFPFTEKDINWSLNPAITATYKKILALRNNSTALKSGKVKSYVTDDVCAFTKTSDTEQVFVLTNMRNKDVSFVTPSKLSKLKWVDAYTGQAYSLGETVNLSAYSYVVLKSI